MQTSPPFSVISDASCLILLAKIGHLPLLQQLFTTSFVTPTVAAEYGDDLPAWIQLATPVQPRPPELAAYVLDAGEFSALALALEMPDCFVVLDDNAARRAAHQLHLSFTGTAGLLVLAKKRGIIPSVRPLLAALRTAGMWLSDQVAERVCRAAGE